mgnify:CR=1 FL=1
MCIRDSDCGVEHVYKARECAPGRAWDGAVVSAGGWPFFLLISQPPRTVYECNSMLCVEIKKLEQHWDIHAELNTRDVRTRNNYKG